MKKILRVIASVAKQSHRLDCFVAALLAMTFTFLSPALAAKKAALQAAPAAAATVPAPATTTMAAPATTAATVTAASTPTTDSEALQKFKAIRNQEQWVANLKKQLGGETSQLNEMRASFAQAFHLDEKKLEKGEYEYNAKTGKFVEKQ